MSNFVLQSFRKISWRILLQILTQVRKWLNTEWTGTSCVSIKTIFWPSCPLHWLSCLIQLDLIGTVPYIQTLEPTLVITVCVCTKSFHETKLVAQVCDNEKQSILSLGGMIHLILCHHTRLFFLSLPFKCWFSACSRSLHETRLKKWMCSSFNCTIWHLFIPFL